MDVIVVTAVNDAENIREVLPFGVVDYLLKPFAGDRFAKALERFVQRRPVINAMSGLDQQGIDALFSSGLKEQELSRQERLERKGLKAHDYQMLLDCWMPARNGRLRRRSWLKSWGCPGWPCGGISAR